MKSKMQGPSELQNKSMLTQNEEGYANELKTKLGNLESADVFLQETSRLGMEKTVILEKTIDQLIKGKSKHQEDSIKTVDLLKRDISAEKLKVNLLEIFIKNCQEQKLDENSAVENRIDTLDKRYRNVLKETVSLKEMIECIT